MPELLGADELYVATLRKAVSIDTYTLAGGGPGDDKPAFCPRFRYAEIDAPAAWSDGGRGAGHGLGPGADRPVQLLDPRLDQLFNVIWSPRGNLRCRPTVLGATAPGLDRRYPGVRRGLPQHANADADGLPGQLAEGPGAGAAQGAATISASCPMCWAKARRGAPAGRRGGGRALAAPGATAIWSSCGGSFPACAAQGRLVRVRACSRATGPATFSSATGSTRLPRPISPTKPPPRAATSLPPTSASAPVWSPRPRLLGEEGHRRRYAALSRDAAAAAWGRWGAHAMTTQAGCAVAIELGVAPTGEVRAVSDALAALVDRAEGRIAAASSARRWCCRRCAAAATTWSAYGCS